MRHLIIPGMAAVLVLLARAPVYADERDEVIQDCREALQSMEAETKATATDRPALSQPDVRTLRDAAMVFARAGDPDGCAVVVREMRELLKEQRKAREHEKEIERVRAARPVTDLGIPLHVSALVGTEVVNDQLNDLGTIEDVIFAGDQDRYVLVSHGGFLGLGETLVPVEVSRLRLTEDGKTFVLNVTEDVLDQAPEVSRETMRDVGKWSAGVQAWWSQNIDKTPAASQ